MTLKLWQVCCWKKVLRLFATVKRLTSSSSILAAFGWWIFAAVMWGLYWLFAIVSMIFSIIKDGFSFPMLLIPFIFLILHVSYGVGTIGGLFNFTRLKKA